MTHVIFFVAAMLKSKDREIFELKAKVAEFYALTPAGGVMGTGVSAAPGGFPATSRASATSGRFVPATR